MHGYLFFGVVFLFHSFVYSERLILGRGAVAPDPILGIPGVRQEYILDGHYTHRTPTDADTHRSRVSNSLFTYCLCFWEVGGKRKTQMKPNMQKWTCTVNPAQGRPGNLMGNLDFAHFSAQSCTHPPQQEYLDLCESINELCRFRWTAAAPLKSSQIYLACPFMKAVPQSLCRLVWFNTGRTTVHAIFSIHFTNPYYNVYIVALSFNLCVRRLVQSQKKGNTVLKNLKKRKEKKTSQRQKTFIQERAPVMSSCLSHPVRERVQQRLSTSVRLTAQAYLFGSVT